MIGNQHAEDLRRCCDALEAENKRLREALTACIAVIQRDRDELEQCAIDPRTGGVSPDDKLTLDDIKEYETALTAARAALQEKSND